MSRVAWPCLVCLVLGIGMGGVGTYKFTVPERDAVIAALNADKDKFLAEAAKAEAAAERKNSQATEEARKVENETIRELNIVAAPARRSVAKAKAATGGVDIDVVGPRDLSDPVRRMREAAVQAGNSDSGQAGVSAGTPLYSR